MLGRPTVDRLDLVPQSRGSGGGRPRAAEWHDDLFKPFFTEMKRVSDLKSGFANWKQIANAASKQIQ